MDYLYHDGHARPLLYDIKRSGFEFDSYTTTATYGTVFEWVTKYMGKKYFRLTATDNPVTVKITGSHDGVNYDYAIQTSTVGTTTPVLIEADQFLATVKIEAQDATSGAHGILDVVLTATSQPTSGPMDGSNSIGKAFTYAGTTTSNNYTIIGTVNVAGYPGVSNSISATTHDLLFKFEYTRDGVTWVTSIEDYPVTAGSSAVLTAVRTAFYYRVSVKPAVPGDHGSYTWMLVVSNVIVPVEYKSAFAYEPLTITNAKAVGLTTSVWAGGASANITVEDNPIRVRWDGEDPEVDEGHLLQSGDQMKLDFTADLWHFRAIAVGADAKIKVTYSR